MIEWLKERGCHWYDLGGIDPENNPGVYHFKCGIAGKTGKDETFIGEFDLYSNMRAYLLKIIIAKTKVLRAKMKELSTSAKYFQR
jgi:lipid II:glycine glycyltransferase (peptidoglycan interpeptide bridge formation enzyme)